MNPFQMAPVVAKTVDKVIKLDLFQGEEIEVNRKCVVAFDDGSTIIQTLSAITQTLEQQLAQKQQAEINLQNIVAIKAALENVQ